MMKYIELIRIMQDGVLKQNPERFLDGALRYYNGTEKIPPENFMELLDEKKPWEEKQAIMQAEIIKIHNEIKANK